MIENRGPGPFGREVPISELEIGDVIQLALGGQEAFRHTVLVVQAGEDPDHILIASHDNDANCRPVSTYAYRAVRGIHLEGVRYVERGEMP